MTFAEWIVLMILAKLGVVDGLTLSRVLQNAGTQYFTIVASSSVGSALCTQALLLHQ